MEEESVSDPALPYRFFSTEDIIGACIIRFFALLEILAVACVAMEALADHKRKRARTNTYIQLPYQVSLLLKALMFFVGTAATPPSDPYVEIWGSLGTKTTCTIQGLILQFAMASTSAWDFCLTTSFLLIIRYGWQEMRLRKLLKYAHILSWGYAFIMTALPYFYDGYNNASYICWVEVYPPHCLKSVEPEYQVPCQNSSFINSIQSATLFVTPLNMIYAIYCMTTIFFHVHKQQRRNSLYGEGSLELSTENNGSTTLDPVSQEVAVIGTMYASTILLSAVPLMAVVATWDYFYLGFPHSLMPTSLGMSMFCCLGVYNMVVFVWNRKQMQTRYGKAIKYVVDNVIRYLCCCCSLSCLCCCCLLLSNIFNGMKRAQERPCRSEASSDTQRPEINEADQSEKDDA